MKKRYFRLLDDVYVPNRWHLGRATLADGFEPRLRAGIPLDSAGPLTIPITHAGRALDYCLTSFAVPVTTCALAKVVTDIAGADVQVIPVNIPGHRDSVVLNVLRIVRCVDEPRSEFLKWTKNDHRSDLAGQYRSITRLVLNDAAIPADAHIFRMKDSFLEVIVSDTMKTAMESAGCLGASFLPLQCSSDFRN